MGLLRRGQAMVRRRLKESDGVPVTYSRTVNGVTRSAALTATVGRTLAAGLSESGVAVQHGERDYLIDVADLVLPVIGPTTPERGDRIADGAEVWGLSSPQTAEPCWRYSDQFRTVFRCHTKRVNA